MARPHRKQPPERESSLEGEVSPLGSAAAPPRARAAAQRSGEDYRRISEHVLHIARLVPVLSTLNWAEEVKLEFFARGARELPRVSYPDRRLEFRRAEALAREAMSYYSGQDPVDRWLRATFQSYATAAQMLSNLETPAFSKRSVELYGDARTPILKGETRNLDLAQHLLKTVEEMGVHDPPPDEQLSAHQAARALKPRLREAFPGERIKVLLSPNLASKALAGTRRIRLRSDASYTRQELEVLLVHEGLVHIATTLNGIHQPLLRCLGRGSPRTIQLQEGLAVFAEFMGGVADLRRVRRLADRVVAIDMAQQGADFLEVYRYFFERDRVEDEAYENTRRVFRGGDLRGGAPFTKDVVYLLGAARVRSFLEQALAQGNLSEVLRLFVGKIDLEDLEAIRTLAAGGWLAPPRYMPPWVRDPGLLAANLSFGAFFRQLDLSPAVEA